MAEETTDSAAAAAAAKASMHKRGGGGEERNGRKTDRLDDPDEWTEPAMSPSPPRQSEEPAGTPDGMLTPTSGGGMMLYDTTGIMGGACMGMGMMGMMGMDHWDWKTDAPEFVPGGDAFGGMGALGGGGPDCDAFGGAWAAPLGAQLPSDAAAGGAAGLTSEEALGQDASALVGGAGGDEEEAEHVRQQFEWQIASKAEDVQKMQNTVNQLEIEIAQVQTSWEMERQTLIRQIGHYRAVLERYCIPAEEAASGYDGDGFYADAQWGGDMAIAANAMANGQAMGFGGGDPHSSAGVGGATGASGAAAGGFGGGRQQGGKAERRGMGQFGAGNSQQGEGAGGGGAGAGGGSGDGEAGCSLDSKMRQLNSLLQEGSSGRQTSAGAGGGGASGAADKAERGGGGGDGGSGEGGGSIASTLRAMFPNATIHAGRDSEGGGGEDGDEGDLEEEAADVEQMLRALETQVGRQVDERALRSLHGLRVRDRVEALSKVSTLVESQGGICRNLSSILQSVCRKLEKRSSKGARASEASQQPTSASGSGARAGGEAERGPASRGGGGGGGGDGSASEEKTTPRAPPRPMITRQESTGSQGSMAKPNTPAGRRSNRSWADMNSGDEDSGRDDDGDGPFSSVPSLATTPTATPTPASAAPSAATAAAAPPPMPTDGGEDEEGEYWTTRRIEKAARRSFDLRNRGGHWELKINMSNQDPSLCALGMKRYCAWLTARLGAFREEHGPEPLRTCRGEVDFSNNSMSDEMVWMLLEALTQGEVHVAMLKLFGNQIGQGGVLAICEFIRANHKADPVQELHLSHNHVDDEPALELLRTMNEQRPRYPPSRPGENSGEALVAPVWLRLNYNRVRDPDQVRKKAEAEGIMICTAADRNICGTSRCGTKGPRGEIPVVHLYTFKVQNQ